MSTDGLCVHTTFFKSTVTKMSSQTNILCSWWFAELFQIPHCFSTESEKRIFTLSFFTIYFLNCCCSPLSLYFLSLSQSTLQHATDIPTSTSFLSASIYSTPMVAEDLALQKRAPDRQLCNFSCPPTALFSPSLSCSVPPQWLEAEYVHSNTSPPLAESVAFLKQLDFHIPVCREGDRGNS